MAIVLTDFDGIARPQGFAYDIGPYEFQSVSVPGLWVAESQNPAGMWSNSTFDNRSVRILIKGANITQIGTSVSVRLRGRSSGNYTVAGLHLVTRTGATLDGDDGTSVAVLFSASTSVTVTPAGVTSDAVAFTIVPGTDVFLTGWLTTGNASVLLNGGNVDSAWFVTGSDESSTIDWGGLTISEIRSFIYMADLIVLKDPDPPPPTTPGFDDFNRADENPIDPGAYANGGQSGWKVVSNQAANVGTVKYDAFYSKTQLGKTQQISVEVGTGLVADLFLYTNSLTGSYQGGSETHVELDIEQDSDEISIWKYDGGGAGFEQINTGQPAKIAAATAIVAGDVFTWIHDAIAHTLKVWQNFDLLDTVNVTIHETNGFSGVSGNTDGAAPGSDVRINAVLFGPGAIPTVASPVSADVVELEQIDIGAATIVGQGGWDLQIKLTATNGTIDVTTLGTTDVVSGTRDTMTFTIQGTDTECTTALANMLYTLDLGENTGTVTIEITDLKRLVVSSVINLTFGVNLPHPVPGSDVRIFIG